MTAERRRKHLEDVAKRRMYRKAHGLEATTGFAQYLVQEDDDDDESVEEGKADTQSSSAGIPSTENATENAIKNATEKAGRDVTYADWEGRKRPVKKWLGIW